MELGLLKILIPVYGNALQKDDGLGAFAALTPASLTFPEPVEISTCQLTPILPQTDQAVFIKTALNYRGRNPGHKNPPPHVYFARALMRG